MKSNIVHVKAHHRHVYKRTAQKKCPTKGKKKTKPKTFTPIHKRMRTPAKRTAKKSAAKSPRPKRTTAGVAPKRLTY